MCSDINLLNLVQYLEGDGQLFFSSYKGFCGL